jgi:hypothetical protein
MDELVDYCRAVEAYLCQKNGGHLIRIVGPAFETVRGWSEQGVPLKIAFRGIDRRCERAVSRGGRQRPIRIEFCEADVLEAFDDWRRVIGVTAMQVSETGDPDEWGKPPSRKGSLAAHIERAVSRLLVPKGSQPPGPYDDEIAGVVRELDELAARARHARGESRAAIIARLRELDGAIVAAARSSVNRQTARALEVEADAELAPLAPRMPPEALARARQLAFERLLRETRNLPVLSYE